MDRLLFSFAEGNRVSEKMFGAKLGRSSGPDDPHAYLDPMVDIGVTSVRFTYDVDLGLYDPGDEEITTAAALHVAGEGGMPVTLVLITKNLFLPDTDGNLFTPRALDMAKIAEIKEFVRSIYNSLRVGSDPDMAQVIVDAIELGNEYWGIGEQTSIEYGRLVNVLARVVQEALDEVGLPRELQPHILSQMGSPYAVEFDDNNTNSPYYGYSWNAAVRQSNLDILAQITDPQSRAAIDGLVEHYYYTQTEDRFTYSSTSLRFIDVDYSMWEQNGFHDRDLYITEWNNKLNNPSQYGLKGAGVILEMFESMIRMGVDAASIWPFQHNATGLLDSLQHDSNGGHLFTPRGIAFQMMAKTLVGAERLESNISTELGFNYELNAYETDDSYVFFLFSRTAQTINVNLDLSSVVSSYVSMEATKLGIDPATADGVYVDGNTTLTLPVYADPDAMALCTVLQDFGTPQNLNFTLGAYEVVQLVVTLAAPQNKTGTADGDLLVGGEGKDVLTGLAGEDLMRGNGGDDRLLGGRSWDILRGGKGNDDLQGGAGADRLVGGAGADKLTGGAGVDEFVFDVPPGLKHADRIEDFKAGVDLLVLENAVFRGLPEGRLRASQFSVTEGNNGTQLSHRILYNSDTGALMYDSDGSGRVRGVVFGWLDTDLSLTTGDFLIV